jgi:hypothetical protein
MILPAVGDCARTRPFLTLVEATLTTLRVRQCRLLIAAFALRSVLPTTLGTTQRARPIEIVWLAMLQLPTTSASLSLTV